MLTRLPKEMRQVILANLPDASRLTWRLVCRDMKEDVPVTAVPINIDQALFATAFSETHRCDEYDRREDKFSHRNYTLIPRSDRLLRDSSSADPLTIKQEALRSQLAPIPHFKAALCSLASIGGATEHWLSRVNGKARDEIAAGVYYDRAAARVMRAVGELDCYSNMADVQSHGDALLFWTTSTLRLDAPQPHPKISTDHLTPWERFDANPEYWLSKRIGDAKVYATNWHCSSNGIDAFSIGATLALPVRAYLQARASVDRDFDRLKASSHIVNIFENGRMQTTELHFQLDFLDRLLGHDQSEQQKVSLAFAFALSVGFFADDKLWQRL